jgi:hypothetical protein
MFKPRSYKTIGQTKTVAKPERAARDAWRQELSQMPSMLPSWFEPAPLGSKIADELSMLFGRKNEP